MTALLRFCSIVDRINSVIGRWASWLVLVAVLVSAGNAISRYSLNIASNAWLELQWYLFGAVFMLGAAWTMERNEHVRVDVLSARLPKRVRDHLELWGLLVFFAPFALIHLWLSWPFFKLAWDRGEISTNPGGLVLWPAKLLIVIGFFLLTVQGVSQFIKRIAILRGDLEEEDEMKASDAALADLAVAERQAAEK